MDPFASFLETSEAATLMELVDTAAGDRLKMKATHEFLPNLIQLWHRRRDHAKRFSKANEMLFTVIGAEQATGEAIAAYKAGWARGAKHILVACSGIGGELMSLLLTHPDAQIIAVDNSLAALAASAWNARLYGADAVQFFYGTLEEFLLEAKAEFPAGYFDHCYFDPDRRKSGTKRVALDHYLPLPSEVLPDLELLSKQVHMKISPMIRFSGEEPRHITWISEGMALKECVIHSQSTQESDEQWGEAVHIEDIPYVWSKKNLEELTEQDLGRDAEAGATFLTESPLLLELSPTLLRAGLIEEVKDLLFAKQVHPDSSLLLVDEGTTLPLSVFPFLRIFTVIEELPFAKDLIKEALLARDIQKIVIKKRYFPLEPFQIRQQIQTPEGGDHILFCTTRPGEARVAFLCRRLHNAYTFPKL